VALTEFGKALTVALSFRRHYTASPDIDSVPWDS